MRFKYLSLLGSMPTLDLSPLPASFHFARSASRPLCTLSTFRRCSEMARNTLNEPRLPSSLRRYVPPEQSCPCKTIDAIPGNTLRSSFNCAKTPPREEHIQGAPLCLPGYLLRCRRLQAWMDDWSICQSSRRKLWSFFKCRYHCQMGSLGALLAHPGCHPCWVVVHGARGRPR
jgi:hypothetical protein